MKDRVAKILKEFLVERAQGDWKNFKDFDYWVDRIMDEAKRELKRGE